MSQLHTRYLLRQIYASPEKASATARTAFSLDYPHRSIIVLKSSRQQTGVKVCPSIIAIQSYNNVPSQDIYQKANTISPLPTTSTAAPHSSSAHLFEPASYAPHPLPYFPHSYDPEPQQTPWYPQSLPAISASCDWESRPEL